MKRRDGGFTFVEILFAITLIGVLAIISLPFLANVVDDANTRAEEYNIASIKTGIELKKYKDFVDAL